MPLLDDLRRDGIGMANPMPPHWLDEVCLHLDDKPVYNAHVRAKSTSTPVTLRRALALREWPMFCHDHPDVIRAPHLFEMALSLYPTVLAYFDGESPLLYSMSAFWTQQAFVGAPAYQDTHGWHRDGDDRKQLAIFVYGTDVMQAPDGAHLYQRGTHRVGDDALGRDPREPPIESVAEVLGPAGTVFLADPGGLHLGLRPFRQPRMLAWARWGVSDPPQSYHWDKLSPVPREAMGDRYPSDPELQAAVRHVVR